MKAAKWQGFMTEATGPKWFDEMEHQLHLSFNDDFWRDTTPPVHPITLILQEYVLRQIPEFLATYALASSKMGS